MHRRKFIRGVTAGLLTPPLAAEAQQLGKVYRIGSLAGNPTRFIEAFRQGLRELGWTEGQNFVLEYRSAEFRFERIPDLAADLVARKVDVILVTATALDHVRHTTAGVPVVFVTADDPVMAGFVTGLARPGGRMTGLTSLNIGLDAKRLEILKAALPGVGRVGVLSTPHDRTHDQRVAAAGSGARSMRLQLQFFEVPSADRLPGAFDAASRARVRACAAHLGRVIPAEALPSNGVGRLLPERRAWRTGRADLRPASPAERASLRPSLTRGRCRVCR